MALGPHIDLSMLKQVTDMQDILDFTFPIHVLATRCEVHPHETEGKTQQKGGGNV